MKQKPLWKVSVATSREAEDAVVELLAEVFATIPSVYADSETGETIASIYTAKVAETSKKALHAGLERIRECGLDIGPGAVASQRIRAEDWAESWKRHFKPLEVSRRLLVKPSWSKRRVGKGQAVVVLDPGLSFGTGQHPTTGFCLAQLDSLRNLSERQTLLDVGCGSGILAIAAAKLGYAPVEAFDFDPDAVRVAQENAAFNGVDLKITRRDLTKLPVETKRTFSVVCANLTYDLLIAGRDTLLNRVAPEGTLVVAGILKEQFPAVERAFRAKKLRIEAEATVGEWKSAAFRRA